MSELTEGKAHPDRAALWLHLATEDAVRAANAGDTESARRRIGMAGRVAAAFAATGVAAPAVVESWAADTSVALAARGVGRLAVAPWWATTPHPAPRTDGEGAAVGDLARRRRAVSAYMRWLASALLAAWPTPRADAPAIIREAADAFRYVGVVDGALQVELNTAVQAVADKRFPDGWATPPWAPGARTGRAAVERTVLSTRTGSHRVSEVEGSDDGWSLQLERVEGFVPPADPVWAVDDRAGLYFGAVQAPTAPEPRVQLQPALQVAAAEVTVHVGVFPAPATATVGLDRLVIRR